MKPIRYLTAGLLGVALSLDASATIINRTVTLDPSIGSFTIAFDDTTAAGNCGAACSVSAISLAFDTHTWTTADVQSLAVVFDPATFVSSWALSLSYTEDTRFESTSWDETLTGNGDHSLTGTQLLSGFRIIPGLCERLLDADGNVVEVCDRPRVQEIPGVPADVTGTWRSAASTQPDPRNVPEPATAGLALVGLVAMFARGRRRNGARC